jgi:hypothetical protein
VYGASQIQPGLALKPWLRELADVQRSPGVRFYAALLLNNMENSLI